MAQIRVIKPTTLVAARLSANYINPPQEVAIIEIRLLDYIVRLTESEWEYLVEEVGNARRKD